MKFLLQTFLHEYEVKTGYILPIFLKYALTLSSFDSRLAFERMREDMILDFYHEITLQSIRFAKASIAASNEINCSAHDYMIERRFSCLDEFVLPIRFKEYIHEIVRDCSKSTSNLNQGPSPKRPKNDDDNNAQDFYLHSWEIEKFPKFLQVLIENAMHIKLGYKGNRYQDIIKDLAAFIFIRGGNALYEFFHFNLLLPESSIISSFISNQSKRMRDGVLLFGELKEYLEKNKYALEVSIVEDGTKVFFRSKIKQFLNILIFYLF